jgi:hypothetical protein
MPLTLTAFSTEWVTVSELKDFANITSSSADAELDLMRDAAQDAVEGLVGPVLWRNVTETVVALGGVAVLGYRPVVSLTSVLHEGAAVTYTTTGTAGILTGIRGYNGRDLTVTYVAGRTTVPAALRLATLIIAAHLWETQRGNSPSSALPLAEETAAFGMGYGIPNRAKDLLAPYLMPAGVA